VQDYNFQKPINTVAILFKGCIISCNTTCHKGLQIYWTISMMNTIELLRMIILFWKWTTT